MRRIKSQAIGIDTHPELTKEHCDFIVDRFKALANGDA